MTGKKAPYWWVIIAMLVAAGAGVATGTVLSGHITAEVPVSVSQSILIDYPQFDIEDISDHAQRRFVAVSDDRTAFTAGAEIATGEEVAIDVPLINVGDTDAVIELTLEAPEPLILYAEPFWSQETYTKSVSGGTITRTSTTPSPIPFTSTLEQSRNSASEVHSQPTGSVTISPQDKSVGPGAWPNGASGDPSITVVDSGGWVGGGNSITALNQDNIFISYTDITNGDLKFARWDGVAWTTTTVDNGPWVGWETSIAALDPNNIFISYYDLGNGDLKFARWDGLVWTTTTIDSAGDVGDMTSIAALDPNNIFISYYDATNGDLKFARWDGLVWTTTTIDSGGVVGWDSSITALDPNNIFISYYDSTNTNLKLAKWDGVAWTVITVDSDGSVGRHTSIDAVDPNNIYISYFYQNGYDLKFAHWDGATWNITTVDSAGYLGYFTSIDAVDTNNIFISYYDWVSPPNVGSLKLARWNGITWATSTIEHGGNVGWSSISIVALDEYNVFISYYDDTDHDNGDLKFFRGFVYYPGTFTLDADGDGALDTVYFVLTDPDTNGDIDWMELTSDDSTFGEAPLGNSQTGSDDDELINAGVGAITSMDVTLGTYEFTVTFQHALVGGNATASVTSHTWFTSEGAPDARFDIDADGDGTADEEVIWAISDINSDGLYDRINLSMNDTDFGDGNIGDGRVGLTEDDDEIAPINSFLIFGDSTNAAAPCFTISRLDVSPGGDATPNEDVGITSPWYVGTFDIDIDGDQIAEILDFVLVDEGISEGIYNKLNIDHDDSGAYTADEVHISGELIFLGGMKIEVTFPTTAASLIFRQGKIITVVYNGPNSWLISVPAQADSGFTQDNVRIKVCTPDDVSPGYFLVTGTFKMNHIN